MRTSLACGLQDRRRTAYSWPSITERGPIVGFRMSKVRRTLSTPPVATTVSLYLFQSWVRLSAGAAAGWPGAGPAGDGACTGMADTRWYLAEEGVRRSNMRRWESEETADMRAGLEGQKDVL